MFTFLNNLLFGIIRSLARKLFRFSVYVIGVFPPIFACWYFGVSSQYTFFLVVGMIFWLPVLFLLSVLILKIINVKNGSFSVVGKSCQYPDATDDFSYESNRPMYTPKYLVESEIPNTIEHLEKYGSFD